MAAPPWPPRPDIAEQRSRSFPDRAGATAPAAGLGAAAADRVIAAADGAVLSVATAQELRAVLRHRVAERRETTQ